MPSRAPRILIALLCLAAARVANAQTANRWLILDRGDPVVELDTTTTAKSPEGFPRVWLRITYNTVHGAADKKFIMMKWRVDFNCAKRRDNITEAIQYAENGDIVSSLTQPYPLWTEVVPETLGETVLNGFCTSKFARL
jgi:hypothetical protein